MKKLVQNDLYDYKNRYIFQYEKCFKFSIDSILLAEFVEKLTDSKNVLDLCTGNAAVPLILTTKKKCNIDCIEIQQSIYELAKKSIEYNKLSDLITVYNIDANDLEKFVGDKKYDIITCNPPYFKVDETSYVNEIEELMIARHEVKITLDDVFKIASEHLDDKGELYLVHQTSRLDEIIYLGFKYNLRVKRIQLIKSTEIKKPSIVLIKAVKGSKNGLIINDIKCIDKYKTYQGMFKEDV